MVSAAQQRYYSAFFIVLCSTLALYFYGGNDGQARLCKHLCLNQSATSVLAAPAKKSLPVKTDIIAAMEQKYTLPPLPYAYDALEPHISKQIMELHHSKHHQTYVNNLNAALASQVSAIQAKDVPQQIANQQAIKFNGGGHINHSLFWENLAPASSSSTSSAPQLIKAIDGQYGSLEGFQDKFGKALLGIQGSGWGWLVKDADSGRLAIVTTKDQDPVAANEIPIFGVDMWEHAYYLQYLNGKPKYVENIWKVINWKTAEQRFQGGRAEAFKVLKASM